MRDDAPAASVLLDLIGDILFCLRFYSRLPVPTLPFERDRHPVFAEAVRVLPLAGLVVGACGAAILALCHAAGLPNGEAAVMALAGLVLTSGGLHEDGLADMADGFGGGATRERKLAIMRDSHIGTYGVLAVVLALLLRAEALTTLLDRSGLAAAMLGMLASAAASRALTILPLVILDPARPDGLGRSAGRPSGGGLASCFGLAAVLGLALPLWGGFGIGPVLLACGAAALAAVGIMLLALRQIGGHTGDVAGASQQAGEIAYLTGLLIAPYGF
jgi:adenosylcobinamide-GDP ribazoletransferase